MNRSDSVTQLQETAERTVRRAEASARRFYAVALPSAQLDFTLRGRCAGQAQLTRAGETRLRFNLTLLADNVDDFLKQTIPHEVAHLVVLWQARGRSRPPRPHGPEWQQVMRDCFHLEPVRCHPYHTTPARVVPRNFRYACNCRIHLLTAIMHNRIVSKRQVVCKICRSRLFYLGKANVTAP